MSSRPVVRARRQTTAPSMMDVAKAAGVSHQTVSRVINGSDLVREQTRIKVVRAIESLGYRRNAAARTLVTNRSGRLGVIAAHLAERGPSALANAVQEAARDEGFEAVFVGLRALTPAVLNEAVNRLLDQAVEAIVVAVTHRESLATVESLALDIPVVAVEGAVDARPMSAGVAQYDGGRLATAHLLDHGHRAVAHVAGPLAWVEASERRRGWLGEHRGRGLEPGPEWEGDWSPEAGYLAGLEIARTPGVSAVFVANDQMALGVLLAISERGQRVPQDVSVVGFDDLPESRFFSPPLSTIRQDFVELAARAVDLCIRAISGETDPSSELVVPQLVERSSCTDL